MSELKHKCLYCDENVNVLYKSIYPICAKCLGEELKQEHKEKLEKLERKREQLLKEIEDIEYERKYLGKHI